MRRIRSGKTLSLGIPKAPQGNIQGRLKCLSLGMPRKASPLSSTSIGNFTWSYIFIHQHDMCFFLEHLVLFVSLCLSMPQSSFLYTPFERDRHDSEIIRILCVLHLYLLSYIVLLQYFNNIFQSTMVDLFYRNFCSLMLHLYYFQSPTKQHGNLL